MARGKRRSERGTQDGVDRAVTIEELNVLLHDAWLDLDDVVPDRDSVNITGFQQVWDRTFRLARFAVTLTATGVRSIEFDDREGQGGIAVCSVQSTDSPSGLWIEGCIPASLRLLGDDLDLHLTISAVPFEAKRPFGSWKPADPMADEPSG